MKLLSHALPHQEASLVWTDVDDVARASPLEADAQSSPVLQAAWNFFDKFDSLAASPLLRYYDETRKRIDISGFNHRERGISIE